MRRRAADETSKSYLANATAANLETWEREASQIPHLSIGTLSHRRRMAIMLTVGLVTAIEIQIACRSTPPDMQGNVAANAHQINGVLTPYNLGFLCS
jgi:hypothetical protein